MSRALSVSSEAGVEDPGRASPAIAGGARPIGHYVALSLLGHLDPRLRWGHSSIMGQSPTLLSRPRLGRGQPLSSSAHSLRFSPRTT